MKQIKAFIVVPPLTSNVSQQLLSLNVLETFAIFSLQMGQRHQCSVVDSLIFVALVSNTVKYYHSICIKH